MIDAEHGKSDTADEPENPLGWLIPFWLTAELVFVAESWHMPPDVWLRQDARIRSAMLKYNRLRGETRARYKGDRASDDLFTETPLKTTTKRF